MQRLQYFPIPFFAVIMGISGLSIAMHKAVDIFGISAIFSDILTLLSVALFVAISILYTFKTFKFFSSVKHEFNHPIRLNFFGTISISLLLLSISIYDYLASLSFILCLIGILLHTFLTFYVVRFWIDNSFDLSHFNPAWFIPIVGNVLVPVAGINFFPKEFLAYYFSIGIFFWIILSSVLFYRIIFHHQLAEKFLPTLFIFIAPPAVSFIAYIKLYGSFDVISSTLLNIAIFFALLFIFMFKKFSKIKFFISWWAFTFPLDALSIALMVAYSKTNLELYKHLAACALIVATIVVFVVLIFTIINIFKQEICVEE